MSRRRRVAIGAPILALLVAAGIAGLVVGNAKANRRAERRAVQDYYATIQPLAFEGGRIVQQEVKPRITDFREGLVRVQQFQDEADNWIRQFRRIRREFADAPHPARLDRAAALYDQALERYIAAFEAFRAAAGLATHPDRVEAISAAVPIAEEADDLYDRARDALSAVMRDLDLEPPADL